MRENYGEGTFAFFTWWLSIPRFVPSHFPVSEPEFGVEFPRVSKVLCWSSVLALSRYHPASSSGVHCRMDQSFMADSVCCELSWMSIVHCQQIMVLLESYPCRIPISFVKSFAQLIALVYAVFRLQSPFVPNRWQDPFAP